MPQPIPKFEEILNGSGAITLASTIKVLAPVADVLTLYAPERV